MAGGINNTFGNFLFSYARMSIWGTLKWVGQLIILIQWPNKKNLM